MFLVSDHPQIWFTTSPVTLLVVKYSVNKFVLCINMEELFSVVCFKEQTDVERWCVKTQMNEEK